MQPDFLSQLHDINPPESVDWWPLAWGWWAMIVIALALIVYLVVQLRNRIHLRKAKKAALSAIANIDPDLTPIAQAKLINDILKRVVLAYSEREEVAGLYGSAWANWLNEKCNKGPAIDPSLASLAYQRECEAAQVLCYKQQVQAWIINNLPLTASDKKPAPIAEASNV